MVKLSQFVSRNILTRDKMSQPLVACGLVLGACSFFYFLGSVTLAPPLLWVGSSATYQEHVVSYVVTDPRSTEHVSPNFIWVLL